MLETEYVCGFAFDKTKERVVLILKNRPDFLAGKYNGVGGKIEKYDNIYSAMIREFEEETSCVTEKDDWLCRGSLSFSFGTIFFFEGSLTDEQLNSVKTVEDEEILVTSTDDVLGLKLPIDRHAFIYFLAMVDSNLEHLDMRLSN